MPLKKSLLIKNFGIYIKIIQKLQPFFYNEGFAFTETHRLNYKSEQIVLFKNIKNRRKNVTIFFSQKPIQTFYKLKVLLNSPNINKSFKIKKKIVLLFINVLLNFNNRKNPTIWPLYFCHITRSISIDLRTQLDNYVILLFLNTLLSNFNSTTHQKTKKSFSIVVENDWRLLDKKKVKLTTLNELGLFKLLVKCRHNKNKKIQNLKDAGRYNEDPLEDWQNRPSDFESFEGVKIFLGETYFNPLLNPLKEFHKSIIIKKSIRDINIFLLNSNNGYFLNYNWKFWNEHIKKWKCTSTWTSTYKRLKKDVKYFKYGINHDWAMLNSPTNREALVKYSPYFSNKTISPFFHFSYYRQPYFKYVSEGNLYGDFNNYETNSKSFKEIYLIQTFFFTKFFEYSKSNTKVLYYRNLILHFLKKKHKKFDNLTVIDKQLKLMNYGITYDTPLIANSTRPPFLHTSLKWLELRESSITKIYYDSIQIKFNWENFTIIITGLKIKTKAVILIASLYWNFKETLVFTDIPSNKIIPDFYYQPFTKNTNKIYYYESNTPFIKQKTFKKTFWDLDKNFITQILSQQNQKKYIILKLKLHPKVFWSLAQTTLVSNDKKTLKTLQKSWKLLDYYYFSEYWGSQPWGSLWDISKEY